MIAEIQCSPNPSGTPDNPHAHIEAAIAVIQDSGLHYEVGPLGTTLEGEPDQIWDVVRRAHEACRTAGAQSVLSAVKFAEVDRTMASLTDKFR